MKLTDKDLVSIIRAHRRDSLGAEDGDLSNQRAEAMDHYHGRPYGNEVEGRSQVVSKDLAEAVDWAMPAIMRVFTQSGALGEFDPVGPEDEQLAQQESDYVNQVIMKDNPGFMVLHDVIKDTLLLKNGYVKHYWSVEEKISDESYTGLTLDQITKMIGGLEADGAEVEVKGQESRQIMLDGQMPLEVFDIKLQIKRKCGKMKIEAVPAEEVRVSKRCRGSLQTSPFTEHVTRKTRSELIEMGMDRDFVYSLPAYNERSNDAEEYARDSIDDESDITGADIIDRSMDEIEYCEAYILVDWDDDGIAELRKVVTTANRVPPGDDWNEPIQSVPMTGFVAKRIPHRHVGESLDDELADLQEIKTVLMRQLLDNIYLTNNNQWLVNERVNLKDFMQSLPGGVKRVQGMEPVSGAAEPVMATPIVQQILPVVDYMDGLKESRTGISRASTGLDPDILKQSTKGAFLENLNRASQKIEMITRLLAESGVKELVLQVHSLLIRHQDKARMVQMRGNWVNVNPQEWRERTDLTVRVGLGTGNEEEKREKLLLLAQLQEKIAAIGLVGPQQAYAMFEDIVKTLGFELPEKYAMSPNSPEYQQAQANKPPPFDPLVEAEKIKSQTTLQKAQGDAQVKMQEVQANLQAEQMKAQFEAEKAAQIEQVKAQFEAQKSAENLALELEAQKQIEQMKIDAAREAKLMELAAQVMQSQQAAQIAQPEQPAEQPNMQLEAIMGQIAQLASVMAAPKMIVRDANGRAIGVQSGQ